MDELEAPPPSTLRRRNSIATSVVIPNKLAVQTSSLPNSTTSSPPLFFELVSLNSSLSYTSLKDLLPSSTSINSPTATASASSLYEISIRNRLVKHAAWAYLKPMSSSRDSSAPHFIRRLWLRFFNFINCQVIPGIARAFDCIFRLINI